ncbi:Alpha/Beta hydrolase protein [Ochromonadaceae sp. CCMP2298]|nr:Alpha/Beta hydrolase protein [Ochromonadaceae sp. CCMP2298]
MFMSIDQPPLPVYEDSDIDSIRGFLSAMEQVYISQAGPFFADMPEVETEIESETLTILGEDANDIVLHIVKPTGDEELPCLLFLHGGGMAVNTCSHPMYTKAREFLAAKVRAVVVGVEFRNAGGVLGPHPFPAGLHDCRAALHWANGMRESRRFSKVVLVGDSGGGNLCISLALLAKPSQKQCQEQTQEQAQGLERVDGVYAMCPYISGLYSKPDDQSETLPSLALFDGVAGMGCLSLHYFARAYDPPGENSRNPLAWPYHATPAQLAGLPPFVVSLNEADPLHDEGKVFFRRLLAAGVSARCRTLVGSCHAGDLIGMKATHDIFLTTMMDVKAFVDGL